MLSTKTNDSAQTKAHGRYCSTVTLSDPVSVEYDDATNETNRFRPTMHPGSGNDVEHCALGGTRGPLSNYAALVSYAAGLGSDVVVDYPNPFT